MILGAENASCRCPAPKNPVILSFTPSFNFENGTGQYLETCLKTRKVFYSGHQLFSISNVYISNDPAERLTEVWLRCYESYLVGSQFILLFLEVVFNYMEISKQGLN